MHELGITKRILDIALRTASEQKASKIKAVRLKVGEWTSIEPSCIEFYFTAIAVDTPAEGASVIIERIPLEAKCIACGNPFVPTNLIFKCPGCGSPDVEIMSGREFFVESVEVE